jgi:hypothetical protein
MSCTHQFKPSDTLHILIFQYCCGNLGLDVAVVHSQQVSGGLQYREIFVERFLSAPDGHPACAYEFLDTMLRQCLDLCALQVGTLTSRCG